MIKNLVPNKENGHDMISIRMKDVCKASICKPLESSFRSCLEKGKFPIKRKKYETNVELMWFPYIKKEINKIQKTIAQYLCFLLLGKYLKEYCIITCMNSLQKKA